MIYLDHAATSPMPPEILEEMAKLAGTVWGNASSMYRCGRKARQVLDEARAELGEMIGAEPSEIFFTSGGTESDNWALRGICDAHPEQRHIITSQIEHPAVLNPCRWLERLGYSVTYVPVGADGTVSPETVRDAIRPDTVLISIQMANNEIGTIEPVREIGTIAGEHGIIMHTDAVQAAGQMKLDLASLPVDLLSLSGHKFGAPKGIGALYVRRGIRIEPLLRGGEQEKSFRAGTENVLGAKLMASALRLAAGRDHERLARMRDGFMDHILSRFPDVCVNGSRSHRLPGNMHFSIPGIGRESLLMQLDMAGIAASAGSACTAGIVESSHVIRAIGGDMEAASLRLTLGEENTETEMTEAAESLCRILDRRKGNR